MTAYYNEIDPKAAAWLRELIKQGHIAPGEVDERSITDITPQDLLGYDQHHFFAGIGVWSHALRQAGWPDDKPVWTGSCPCQPFSQAGKGAGHDDERHLWPSWFHLIEICRPGVVFGEQVASKAGLGWYDLVQTDLEGAGYASAAIDLCAACVGAPHIRQRLYFVAEGVDNAAGTRQQNDQAPGPAEGGKPGRASAVGRVAQSDGGDSGAERQQRSGEYRLQPQDAGAGMPGPTNGYWRNADWLGCRDGKWRAVEPGTFPLVNGAPARVGRLRGYGNAIVAPVAEAFISAYLETKEL